MIMSSKLYNDRIEIRQRVIHYTVMVRMARYLCLHRTTENTKEDRAHLDNMRTKLKLYADKLCMILYSYNVRDLI